MIDLLLPCCVIRYFLCALCETHSTSLVSCYHHFICFYNLFSLKQRRRYFFRFSVSRHI
jgi:hypothetical protein